MHLYTFNIKVWWTKDICIWWCICMSSSHCFVLLCFPAWSHNRCRRLRPSIQILVSSSVEVFSANWDSLIGINGEFVDNNDQCLRLRCKWCRYYVLRLLFAIRKHTVKKIPIFIKHLMSLQYHPGTHYVAIWTYASLRRAKLSYDEFSILLAGKGDDWVKSDWGRLIGFIASSFSPSIHCTIV